MKDSKYLKNLPPPDIFHLYDVLNQGQNNNLLLICGDSHAEKIGFRFMKLYEDAVQQNKTSEFPTIVFLFFSDSVLIPTHWSYQIVTKWIAQFKPNRTLFVYRWPHNWHSQEGLPGREQTYSKQNFYKHFGSFINNVKEWKKMGLDIYITNFQRQSSSKVSLFVDINGLYINYIQSSKLSQYNSKYTQQIAFLQKQVKDTSAEIVRFEDHQCWENQCYPFTSGGYPLYFDSNHYTWPYSAHWAGAVDYVTDFKK